MEKEWVQKNQWVTSKEFQTELALAKLFPGPLATLLGVRLAADRAGPFAGILAGVLLILPAFLMVLGGSFILTAIQNSPNLNPVLVGFAWSALILSFIAVWRLTRPQLENRKHWALIAVIAFVVFQRPTYEPALVIGTGILYYFFASVFPRLKNRPHELGSLAISAAMFWACFQASCITFGSGIAIVPALQAVFVEQNHWITQHEFLDGLFLGQITPGPLLIVSTFLGFKVTGLQGAIAATFGAFLPAFIIALGIMPHVRTKFNKHDGPKIFLEGVLIAVAGALLGSSARICLYAMQGSPYSLALWWPSLIALGIWAFKKAPSPFTLIPVSVVLSFLVSKIHPLLS